ncbi:aldo/keto reductase, partial [Nocardia cyriacigeorgica]|uniref:aldo/keto reductase n=1 Tax=Nocardia cyriacigeorgica TaxID=135487 RepID=UPI002458E455
MEQRTVGRSGLRVSRIGLATHTWGSRTDADQAAVQLMAFVEAGGTLVDTSPVYAGGAAQRILADLLGDLVSRDDLVLSGCAGLHPRPAPPAAPRPPPPPPGPGRGGGTAPPPARRPRGRPRGERGPPDQRKG